MMGRNARKSAGKKGLFHTEQPPYALGLRRVDILHDACVELPDPIGV